MTVSGSVCWPIPFSLSLDKNARVSALAFFFHIIVVVSRSRPLSQQASRSPFSFLAFAFLSHLSFARSFSSKTLGCPACSFLWPAFCFLRLVYLAFLSLPLHCCSGICSSTSRALILKVLSSRRVSCAGRDRRDAQVDEPYAQVWAICAVGCYM